MERITEKYGQTVNHLRLTGEELENLEPFLRALGVRMRSMVVYWEDGVRIHEVQAENPYKDAAQSTYGRYVKEYGDSMMDENHISAYKR